MDEWQTGQQFHRSERQVAEMAIEGPASAP
jgi:hypothetical protein